MLSSIAILWDRPWALWGLLALGVVIFVHEYRRSKGKRVTRVSLGLQLAAVALLMTSLAGPQITAPHGGQILQIIDDISNSTRGQNDTPLPLDVDMHVISWYVGENVAMDRAMVSTAQTRIDLALQMACQAVENGDASAIVIRTDGQFGQTAWEDPARQLGQLGVSVTIAPYDTPPEDVRITRMTIRRQDDQALVTTIVHGSPGARAVPAFRFNTADEWITLDPITFAPGQTDARMTFRGPLNADGPTVCRLNVASLTSQREPDIFPENDSASVTLPSLTERVLILADEYGRWGDSVLALDNVLVDARPLMACPLSEEDISQYTAVILVGPTYQTPASQPRRVLASYVRNGGGLVVVGLGPYGAVTDVDDPLNQVSPLVADTSDRPALDITLVLDTSASMGEAADNGSRLYDLATQAAIDIQRYLTDDDRLAAVVFNDEAQLIYESGNAAVDFRALARAMHEVSPSGGTRAETGLTRALQRPVQGDRRRMVILLTDSRTEPFDADALAVELRNTNALFGVIKLIPSWGEDVERVSDIDTLIVATEGRMFPLVGRDLLVSGNMQYLAELFEDIVRWGKGDVTQRGDFNATVSSRCPPMPPLRQYLRAIPNGTAPAVFAWVGDHPILALRRAGLGRCATLAVPMLTGQNTAWYDSPMTRNVMTWLVQMTRRTPQDSRFQGELRPGLGGRAMLQVRAHDGTAPINGLSLTAWQIDPDGQETELGLLASAGNGEYTLALATGATDAFVEIRQGHTPVLQLASQDPIAAEVAAIGPNWPMLNQLAELTGGVIMMDSYNDAIATDGTGRETRPIGAIILAAALGTMLLEWVLTVARSRWHAST